MTRTENRTGVTTTVTRYTITAVAEAQQNTLDAEGFEVHVELVGQMDGPPRWAVRRRHYCIHRSGRWDFEPQPSSRTDRWLSSHRFDLETALRLAEKAAPALVLNGRRPDGSLAS